MVDQYHARILELAHLNQLVAVVAAECRHLVVEVVVEAERKIQLVVAVVEHLQHSFEHWTLEHCPSSAGILRLSCI